MNIHNISFGDNRIRNIEGQKNSKVADKKRDVHVDSVKLSSSAQDLGIAEQALNELNVEFTPRMKLIQSVSERIGQGYFDDGVNERIAEKMTESSAVTDVIFEIAVEKTSGNEKRAEKIQQARQQTEQGYYDNPMVAKSIAERILAELFDA